MSASGKSDESPDKSPDNTLQGDEQLHGQVPVNGLYEEWFLDYASYVILDRAVPAGDDGLKPVQRRILHAMKEMDDGRFNKVANIIGQTMQYHPHGDVSIGDALVNLGQKNLLIDTQGNWGDVRTGDASAASRYIEARLSKFALDVAFNPKTTTWQLSYDGRKNEPLTLPMKFPLLLAQGAEGIAVGLSTKILPHNFCELIEASIKYLRGKKFELFPDFITGGMLDAGNYNDGKRGGRIKVRTHIEVKDKRTLLIKDVPYGVTTVQLMDSIVKANDNGKIKIKKVVDNTAREVEIEVQLPAGVSPDLTMDALYAFTDCEISISPNACVIIEDKPHFITVQELLKLSAENTKELLKRELEIRLHELQEDWHYSSLEKIFIEKRIYRNIEEETTWDGVIAAIDKGLKPYKKRFKREITVEDITRLTEIKIKRISKYDSFRADEHIKGVDQDMEQVKYDLGHLVDYTAGYYENLLKKYGKDRGRKTEIRNFETIQAQEVAIANTKLYMNAAEGFIGSGLKKDEFVCECSSLDDIIAFTREGKMKVVRIADKVFIGKNLIHVAVFKKNDDRTTYNMIYVDGKTGISFAKRFNVTSVTRDKEYDLTKGAERSKVHYFTTNPNGEAEVVAITLTPTSKARIKTFDFYFEELAIKGRNSVGNQVTRYPIRQIRFKEQGVATLSAIRIWYDDTVGRLNTDERGMYIGSFENDDHIVTFYRDGSYELTSYELTNRYDPDDLVLIEKFDPDRVITAVYYDAAKKQYNVKRFNIETQSLGQKFTFIKEGKNNRLELVTTQTHPTVLMITGKKKSDAKKENVDLTTKVDIAGWKAVGNRLTASGLLELTLTSTEEAPVPEKDDIKPPKSGRQGELF
ncbi:MAG TPA: DNA gyrase/topoisomerase IV subunit A [Chitinophagaceae bacterium]|jgi:topoisomerase-4 subunit A|nr:DNA gyrase/topoisomerase IV subunit A [Chitinophagaceae bacterium]